MLFFLSYDKNELNNLYLDNATNDFIDNITLKNIVDKTLYYIVDDFNNLYLYTINMTKENDLYKINYSNYLLYKPSDIINYSNKYIDEEIINYLKQKVKQN